MKVTNQMMDANSPSQEPTFNVYLCVLIPIITAIVVMAGVFYAVS